MFLLSLFNKGSQNAIDLYVSFFCPHLDDLEKVTVRIFKRRHMAVHFDVINRRHNVHFCFFEPGKFFFDIINFKIDHVPFWLRTLSFYL